MCTYYNICCEAVEVLHLMLKLFSIKGHLHPCASVLQRVKGTQHVHDTPVATYQTGIS